jgi:hypothetical protein
MRCGVPWIGKPCRAADVLDLTAVSAFVLFASYFHGPYVSVTDEVYEDAKRQEAREVVDVDRLVNEEALRHTDVGGTVNHCV